MTKTKNTLADFLPKIQNALKDLVTLEIITAVGNVTEFEIEEQTETGYDEKLNNKTFKTNIYGSKKGQTKIDAKVDKVALTRVHLIQGDITTVYHDAYITDDNYIALREYHDKQRDKGLEIVKGNLEAVKRLLDLLKEE